MATKISQLRTANKAGNTSREFVLLSNIDSNSSSKLALNDVLPTLQSGKVTGSVTEGTAGTTVQELFVGGGVGSSIANSDKSILIFKGINVDDDNGALKIRTDVSTSDPNKKNVVIQLSQSSIDLNVASNSNAKFLSEVGGANALNLGTASHVAGTLPADHGGTGATTLTDGGILIGNGTGAISTTSLFSKGSLLVGTSTGSATDPTELAVGTDNFVLIADSTAANGVKWGKPSIGLITLTQTLDTNNNNIDLGTGFLSGTGSSSAGLRFSNSTNYAYIGNSTPFFGSSVNIEGGIEMGSSNGSAAETIKARSCSSGASPSLTIQASDNTDSQSGGNLVLKAGAGGLTSNGDGGNVSIEAGADGGSGTDGSIVMKTAATTALTINESQEARFENKVSMGKADGLQIRGTIVVSQSTSLSTGVTINTHAGRIRLHASTLAAAAEAEFTVTNSTVTTDSIIMLTVQDNGGTLESNGATLVATIGGAPAAGSFKVRLTNPGSATTTSGGTVHFMVIDVVSS